jgi:2,3,4,5-tetrahydropyridine-2,6-dicarboxylate N-succinyltransferase
VSDYPIARWQSVIAEAWEGKRPLDDPAVRGAVEGAVAGLDAGDLRVAEKRARVPVHEAPGSDRPAVGHALQADGDPFPAEPRNAAGDGEWITNGWLQQALSLYFRMRVSATMEVGPFEFHDKIPLKHGLERLGVRVVPPGVARYGSFLEPGVILMPSYVNIGARVGEGTMVDTWATVGSCAQIGRRVHLSGGVGIGGVLEPPQSRPVIVEDDCFVGSRAIVVEGVLVESGAVIGAGVVLTASTPIVDVRGARPEITRGRVPSRAVVIPGTLPKKFSAGEFGTTCALVIGERKESTDLKTSLNQALREYGVSV